MTFSRLVLVCMLLFQAAIGHGQNAPAIEFAADFPEGIKPQVRQLILESHQQIAGAVNQPFPRPITVEWTADREAFGRRVSMNPEHIMAAAIPAKATVILNGQAFNQSTPGERRVTLAHEYVHLFLGQTGRIIPLWLEEGLAMHLSGDMDMAASEWQMTLAHSLLDRLIPLSQLHASFPGEPARRSLAYRQAYSMTAFIIKRNYPVSGAQGLLADLVDPTQGVKLETWLDDRMVVRGLERSWRDSLSSFGSWISVLVSGTVFWGLISALFLYAYYRRRKRNREIERRWEEEEPWRESVPDEFYEGDDEEEEK